MIQTRPTEESDLDGIDRLFQRGFGHGLSRAAWEWKYRALPGQARSAVAVSPKGTVVAHAGAIALPARWRLPEGGTGEGLLWQTVDFVARGGGGLRPPVVPLMRGLIKELPRPGEAPWLLGFPSARNRRLTERVLESGRLKTIDQWRGDLVTARVGESAEDRPVVLESGDSCAIGGTGADWVEDVWNSCSPQGIVRDAAFLNWRYHARPERFYRFYRLRSGTTEGLAVVAFEGPDAAVMELWLPLEGEWRGALPAIARDLLASGLERWRLWTPPAGGAALTGLGLEREERIHVAYRGRVGQPLAELTALAQGCHYAMGDHDLH